MFVILCVLGVKAGLERKSTSRFNYNSVQKIIRIEFHFPESMCGKYKVFTTYLQNISHIALDECYLGFISSIPGQTEVQK